MPWSALRIETCSQGVAGTRVQLRVSETAVPIFFNDSVAAQVVQRLDSTLNCKGDS